MAARFEVFTGPEGHVLFQLLATDGGVVGTSAAFPSLAEAHAGMAALKAAAAEATVPQGEEPGEVLEGIHMHYREGS